MLGPIVTSLPLSQYFADPKFRAFLGEYAMLWPGPLALPGVLFADTTVGNLVNGAFWTLIFEVMMYATVLTLGIARLLGWRRRSSCWRSGSPRSGGTSAGRLLGSGICAAGCGC